MLSSMSVLMQMIGPIMANPVRVELVFFQWRFFSSRSASGSVWLWSLMGVCVLFSGVFLFVFVRVVPQFWHIVEFWWFGELQIGQILYG